MTLDRITEVLEGMPARFLPRVVQLLTEAEESEREACAKLADGFEIAGFEDSDPNVVAAVEAAVCDGIAAIIRDRGVTAEPVSLADIHALDASIRQYSQPLDHTLVRPEHEELARELLSPPDLPRVIRAMESVAEQTAEPE